MENETITQNPESENREVHHHSKLHNNPKKWKEYFLEFVMIFLAVTLGFFAENIREHFSNREKEKVYIRNLVKNLTADSIMIETMTMYGNVAKKRIDSLMELIQSGKYRDQQETLYRLAYKTRGQGVFQYSNVTYEQMKSTGNFVLIQDVSIRDSLVKYNNYINDVIRGLENRLSETEKKQVDCQNDILDYSFYPSVDSLFYLNQNNISFYKADNRSNAIKNNTEFEFKKLYNVLFDRRVMSQYYGMNISKLKLQNIALLQFLKKEYHLN